MTADDVASGPGRGYHVLWYLVAGALAVVGTLTAVSAGLSAARNDADDAQQAFERSSADIAAALRLSLQHQEDLVVSTSALLVANPDASQGAFEMLAVSAHVMERYPEVLGFGFVMYVPAADLPAFVAVVTAEPPGPLADDGTFVVAPPGEREFYCLTKLAQSRDPGLFPVMIDWCVGSELAENRDTGQTTYSPVEIDGRSLLAVNVPVYAGGVVPATVEARRADFVGWVGTVSLPLLLLDDALGDHDGIAVTMRHAADASDVEYSSGTVALDARELAIDVGNGWTIQTFAVVADGDVLANDDARALMLTGIALSALLAALVLVLGTGRARAWRLVHERTRELRHQALHDALTDLPNRALIADRIEQLLARAHRNGTSCAALFVDLDDFKNVNDSLGHEAGDRLLVAVATRLRTMLREADTIGRMGGDEFVILVGDAELDVAPEMIAARLLDVLRQPFHLEGSPPLLITATVGIASGPRDSGGDLLRDADVALYQAKAAGKDRYEIFEPDMQTAVVRRIELEFDLRSAAEGQQFDLVYQPIYVLADLSLVGVEALLRWDHPTLGSIGPDEFVPILERTGQIQSVGRWVLMQACRQMAAWHAKGDTLDVSVNVSGRQLDHDSIVDDIRGALDASGLDPSSLIIEVTETALMRNVGETALRLAAIKDLGVRIAIDDFGTGYSSLAYLQQFPVDCLKIDRTFTNAITTSSESKALIGTLVQLGRDLGLTTLAEGVETPGEFDQLRDHHVNQVQGTLLSRPLDPQTLESELLEPSRVVASGGRLSR